MSSTQGLELAATSAIQKPLFRPHLTNGRLLDGVWQAHKFCDWHPSASVEVADVNGDGRPDVVLSPSELKGNWHRLSWFEAPADPKQGGWAEHVMADRIECVVHGLATGDFNGDIGADGDLDLMGANWSGPFQPVELWEDRSNGTAPDLR